MFVNKEKSSFFMNFKNHRISNCVSHFCFKNCVGLVVQLTNCGENKFKALIVKRQISLKQLMKLYKTI